MKKLTAKQRDEFLDKAAMMAMQGIIGGRRESINKFPVEDIATDSYAIAQALLAERDRQTEDK